ISPMSWPSSRFNTRRLVFSNNLSLSRALSSNLLRRLRISILRSRRIATCRSTKEIAEPDSCGKLSSANKSGWFSKKSGCSRNQDSICSGSSGSARVGVCSVIEVDSESLDFYLSVENRNRRPGHNYLLTFTWPIDLQTATGQIDFYLLIQQST